MGVDLAELLVSVAKGDRDAFRVLYDRTASKMLGMALRILGRRDIAEEALQEAYLSIWSRAVSFDPTRGAAEAWIATIVRRRSIDRLRASPWLKREIPELNEIDGCLMPLPETLSLRTCLAKLDRMTRYSIILAYIYGLTHAELNERTSIPLGTIKSRLRRGISALKVCLDE